jgi:hypothetical protein
VERKVYIVCQWEARLVRIKSYSEAVRLARSAGEDAANRQARKVGRKEWSETDRDHAASVTESILFDLGFDIAGWVSMAGVPRNEPPSPKPVRKPRRRANAAPVQLNFAFG